MNVYNKPDFKQIYKDILIKKYPEKYPQCESLLGKEELLALDIMKMNAMIFGTSEKNSQKHRSYGEADVLWMLDYQRKNRLSNSQLANHFKLSRNTISKWKRAFQHFPECNE